MFYVIFVDSGTKCSTLKTRTRRYLLARSKRYALPMEPTGTYRFLRCNYCRTKGERTKSSQVDRRPSLQGMQPLLFMFFLFLLLSSLLLNHNNVDAFSIFSSKQDRPRWFPVVNDECSLDRSSPDSPSARKRIRMPMLPKRENHFDPKNKCNPENLTKFARRNVVLSWVMPLVIFGTTASVHFPPTIVPDGGSYGGGVAWAAPPVAVIAEELGYFPVRNANGDVTYIPKRVQRTSTSQSIELAKYMRQKNIYMAGTYWCPHTNRQKELFGEQAWKELQYVECSAKGYRGQPELCIRKHVDGYPTWIFGSTGKTLAGERSLSNIVQEMGFPGPWDEALEESSSPPPPIGGAACK